jgi:two-component system LytT family sensor kinase
MDQLFILATLLLKLGVTVAVASALVRSRRFQELLFRDDRTLPQNVQLILAIGLPFALAAGARVYAAPKSFIAGDLSLESAILMGVVGGSLVGTAGGVLVSLAAALAGGWPWLLFNALAGFLAGQARQLAPNREAMWAFSPFVDLSIYRWLRQHLRKPRLEWQIGFFLLIVALRLLRVQLARVLPDPFPLVSGQTWWLETCAYLTSAIAVAVPLKIWNATRMEIKLEQQERLLLQARMEALQSQINPHFLFNTLNSVASLVRLDPDTARKIIVKLASILRRLLHSQQAFVSLREELDFIDDYLDIEVVRFGPDKLRVIKQIQPETLDAIIPSMLLQPLVENSIKHGLSPRIEGGSITLRSRFEPGDLIIEVEDDGVGIVQSQGRPSPDGTPSGGIGLANVAGRLKVLYGEGASMRVNDRPEGGTLVRVVLPMLQQEQPIEPAYELRSSTSR